jgi:hypothetical protein
MAAVFSLPDSTLLTLEASARYYLRNGGKVFSVFPTLREH